MNQNPQSNPDSANESKRRKIADLVAEVLLQQEREAGRELDLARRAKIIATFLSEMRPENQTRARIARASSNTVGRN